jgi:hypothetical protein
MHCRRDDATILAKRSALLGELQRGDAAQRNFLSIRHCRALRAIDATALFHFLRPLFMLAPGALWIARGHESGAQRLGASAPK